jgi:hypothetical protein
MLNKRTGLIILIFALILNTSCKKDFTTIGNQLIDTPHFEGHLFDQSVVKIYDNNVDKVFSAKLLTDAFNNLPVGAVGVYKDDKFGTLTAGLATSLLPDLTVFNNYLDKDNTKILSARLMIPYHNHTDKSGGNTIYLDSIFGNETMEIKVHELTYLLPTFDPDENLETYRKYFSDFDFTPYKGTVIGDSLNFEVSAESIPIYKRNEDGTFELDNNGDKIVKDSLSPHMVIKLDTTFFRQKIFDQAGYDVLSTEDKFKDYFRGLYIDAISLTGDGTFMMMPVDQGYIEVTYTYDETDDNGTPGDTTDDTVKTIYKEMKLKLAAPMVNHYDNDFSAEAQTALNNSDMINGDEKIYIKGDAGSEAIIQLFDDQQLMELRQNDWMINQAELYLYVDNNAADDLLSEAKRLILYNYDDQKNLTDVNQLENVDNDFSAFDGKLKEDNNGNKYYKFGITRHIRNVLKNDSVNVRLGLRVTNIIPENLKIRNVFKDPDAYNPSGTVLYGNQTVNGTKPVLKIYYTDPE